MGRLASQASCLPCFVQQRGTALLPGARVALQPGGRWQPFSTSGLIHITDAGPPGTMPSCITTPWPPSGLGVGNEMARDLHGRCGQQQRSAHVNLALSNHGGRVRPRAAWCDQANNSSSRTCSSCLPQESASDPHIPASPHPSPEQGVGPHPVLQGGGRRALPLRQLPRRGLQPHPRVAQTLLAQPAGV